MKFLVALNHQLSEGACEAVRDTLALLEALVASSHQVTLVVRAEKGLFKPAAVHPVLSKVRVIPLKASALWNFSERRRFLRGLQSELKKDAYDRTIGMGMFPGMQLCVAYPEELERQENFYDRFRSEYGERRRSCMAVLRPPSVARVCCLSQLQAYLLSTENFVPSQRLCVLPPGLPEKIYGREAYPDDAVRKAIRQKLGFQEEEIIVVHDSDEWYDSGVDRALYTLSVIPDPWRPRCRFVLSGKGPSSECATDLCVLAQKCNFPSEQCRFIHTDDIPLEELLTAADIYFSPVRQDLCGEEIVKALALGVPVICTDASGNCNYVRMAGCPVIPSPFRYETLQDALAFAVPSLSMLTQSTRSFGVKYDFCGRGRELAQLSVDYLPIADHAQEFTLERMRRIVEEHRRQIQSETAIKHETKRSVSRVKVDGQSYIVKEYCRRPWWHLKNSYSRAIRGTFLLRSFTPYCWGQYKDEQSGSRYLIFRDCGEGNFYDGDYARKPEAMELFAECGRILALLHVSGLYHHDTKPANFVVNDECQDEVTNRVCIVDCDNVTAYPEMVPETYRIHNVAQFISGTGRTAEINVSQWQSLTEAFRRSYVKYAGMDKKSSDLFWRNVWWAIREDKSIEQTLPDYLLK